MYEHVFWLEVTVDDTQLKHVLEGVQQLGDEEASSVLAHSTHRVNEVIQSSIGGVLHHHVDDILKLAAGGQHDCAGVAVT